jgi:hypothetical protein
VDIGSVFLCGVMWCGHGHEEADTQLLRATLTRDPGPRCSFLRLDQNHPRQQSEESNGTNGRPATFHPAKRIPTSAAVNIEVTNRPPDISPGKPFDFMQQLAPSRECGVEPPDRAGALANERVSTPSGKAPVSPLSLSCPLNRLHARCQRPGDGFLVRPTSYHGL